VISDLHSNNFLDAGSFMNADQGLMGFTIDTGGNGISPAARTPRSRRARDGGLTAAERPFLDLQRVGI